MNDKEKKTFNDMTEMDRIRYEREMKEYVSRGGKAAKRTKKKKDLALASRNKATKKDKGDSSSSSGRYVRFQIRSFSHLSRFEFPPDIDWITPAPTY